MGTHDAVTARDAVLPRDDTAGRGRPWIELLLGLSIFALYALVVAIPQSGRERAAHTHGDQLFALEKALHIDVERTLNAWLSGQSLWRVLANYEYAITYIVSAFGLLVWLYLRHPERYRTARNAFVLINLAGLACFALYPVMPPRFMPDLGFVDTVRLGRTWGSWGSPLVKHADRFAAMPSLHMAWTVWVGVELAKVSAMRWVQALNALHIVLTLYVIMATANHYLVDALAAVPLVIVAVLIADRIARPRAERVRANDAFFLAVESARAPQHVGGVIMLDTSRDGVSRADLVRLITDRLDRLPRLRQRLAPPGRLRRPVWQDHPAIDWTWHVVERDVGGAVAGRPDEVPGLEVPGLGGPAMDGPGMDGLGMDGPGMDGLRAVIAEAQSQTLPRDRPLWRMVLVQGVAPGRTAVVFLMHHVVADGIGVVAQAVSLMEPPAPDGGRTPPPRGRLREAVGTAIGLGQLAADVAPRTRLPAAGTPDRRFGTVRIPLVLAREVARRHGARVTDVVLCAVAGALHRIVRPPAAGTPVPAGPVPSAASTGRPSSASTGGPSEAVAAPTGTVAPVGGAPPGAAVLGEAAPERRDTCRVAVPLMMRAPEGDALGNHATAVMLDLPIGDMAETERLHRIMRRSRVLRTGTRALAAWFVMRQVGRLMPAPVHARFARAVYGDRFLQGIVSSLPGPDRPLRLAGAPLTEVYPVIPLAPGAPLAVGALGMAGELCFGVSLDPGLVDDASLLTGAIIDVLNELRGGDVDAYADVLGDGDGDGDGHA